MAELSSVGDAAIAFLGWVGQRLPQRFDFNTVLQLSARGEVLAPDGKLQRSAVCCADYSAVWDWRRIADVCWAARSALLTPPTSVLGQTRLGAVLDVAALCADRHAARSRSTHVLTALMVPPLPPPLPSAERTPSRVTSSSACGVKDGDGDGDGDESVSDRLLSLSISTPSSTSSESGSLSRGTTPELESPTLLLAVKPHPHQRNALDDDDRRVPAVIHTAAAPRTRWCRNPSPSDVKPAKQSWREMMARSAKA
jgi:hypothetical protein